MAKAKSKVSSGPVKGPAAEGSTKAIRGNPNKRAAVDKPHEVPVYVTYERHVDDERLLGWTVAIEAWMTSSRVEVKIGRNPYRLEVWVDGKLVHAKNLKRSEVNVPVTEDDPSDFSTIAEWFAGVDLGVKSDGWVTKLGREHAAEKASEQRKGGGRKIAGECKRESHSICTQKPWCECVCHVRLTGRISGDDIIIEEDDSDSDEIIWED